MHWTWKNRSYKASLAGSLQIYKPLGKRRQALTGLSRLKEVSTNLDCCHGIVGDIKFTEGCAIQALQRQQ